MIRIGINVPNFGPETDPASLLDWARYADRNGFATLLVSDHVAPTREVTDTYPAPFYDPFVLLGWLAGQTRTVRLGISVLVVAYRHPLLTARMSAAAHVLSGGRFVLGAGAGWARSEFEALGLDPAARGRIAEAYLGVITGAWQRERISSSAPGLVFHDISTGPVPPGGRVPLWVGGASPGAIRRAARFGDAWHPGNPGLAWLRDAGMPALGQAAAAAAKPVPELVPRIKARLLAEPAGAGRPLGVGTLDQIVANLVALAGLGAAEVIIDPNPDAPRARDFGTEQRQLLEIKDAYEQRA